MGTGSCTLSQSPGFHSARCMSTQGSLDRSLSPPSIPPSLVEKDDVTSENGPCAAIVESADQ
jgi:hypothetical protein